MTALTIRLRTDSDQAAVDELKTATGESTASRALMRAAREYPGLVAALAYERRRIAELTRALEGVNKAKADISDAETAFRRALEVARNTR